MPDEPSQPSTDPSSPPLFEQRAERAFWRGLWDMKKLTLWLAGPSALLMFLNQFVPLWTVFKAGGNAPPKVIIEPHTIADVVEDDAKQPALVLEDTRFDPMSPQMLELICRNRSRHPVFIQEATIEVLRTWELQPALRSRGMLARSAEYDLLLPAGASPAKVALSQEISPNSLDRFALKLGLAPAAGSQACVFAIRLHLSCEGRSVSAGDFLCLLTSDSISSMPLAGANRAALAAIKTTGGKHNSALDKFLASAMP